MLQGVLLVPSHIPPPAVCGALQGGDYSGGGVAASLTRGRGGGAGCVPAALLGGALRYRGGWGGGNPHPEFQHPWVGGGSAPWRARLQHHGERQFSTLESGGCGTPGSAVPRGGGCPPEQRVLCRSPPPPPQIPSPVSLSPPGWVRGAAASPPPALPQDGARRGKVVCQAAL